jgi:hypothetical protein
MKTKIKKAAITCGATAVCVGLAFSPSSQAASTIDQTDSAGNTFQVSNGQDVFKPQFSLWPLGDNNLNIHTVGNTAINQGNNTTGQPWLFGTGAGNVVQVGTGGNIVAPQVAIGVDNHSVLITEGNYAGNNGNGSDTDVKQGYLIDGNGNVYQIAFMQGNIVNPQFAVNGDNYSTIDAYGNYAETNGNGSNTESTSGTLGFVTGNGNVVQIEILSFNVINPQVAVNGSNNLDISTSGNQAYDNGNGSNTTAAGKIPPGVGIPGLFYVYTTQTGNGNVTHVAILSHNVWAPQIAIPGPRPGSGQNTSNIDTLANDAQDNGNGSVTDADIDPPEGGQTGNGNVNQDAHDSGAIFNPQIGSHVNVAAQVQPDPEPEPETVVAKDNDPEPEVKPLVRDSFIAIPGEQPANSDSDSDTKKKPGTWKPGDGIKKVTAIVNGVVDSLKPKPKPAAAADSPAADSEPAS